MAADPIVYCLEQVTDYDQFERLCHDIMALAGYPEIEPLGGSKDKGRDAVHVSRSGEPTVFAYSVREDWLTKLFEDAGKVKKWGHQCTKLVFLTTAYFTSGERDSAVTNVLRDFGFALEIYGIERLRTMLATTHEKVIAKHPQIFCPPFFPRAGGLSLAEARDYLIIDSGQADTAFATWLTSRLSLAGYLVWSRPLAPVAGSSLNDTVEALVRQRGFRYLPIVSEASLNEPEYTNRRAVASAIAKDAAIPLLANSVELSSLDEKLRKLVPIRYEHGWAQALAQLVEVLRAAHCPVSAADARLVLHSFLAPEILQLAPEEVTSNRFPVLSVPEVIRAFNLTHKLDETAEIEASKSWAFRRISPQRVLSLTSPPEEVRRKLGAHGAGGGVWRSVPVIDGVKVDHVVPELIRKSLEVACISKGLVRCPERETLYFPENLLSSDRLYLKKDDGTRPFANVAGRRKFWRPTGSSYYRYHLSPSFSVKRREDGSGDFAALLRVYVRITDDDGTPLKGRTVTSRRKHLCKSWFNQEWMTRTLAIMAWLADDGVITVGVGDERVQVRAEPERWQVSVRINEASIPSARADREDLLSRNLGDDEPESELAEEAE